MSDVTQVEAIYLAATDRTDPADRAAYLDAACGDDADLRRQVDALLAAHPKVGRFLEPPSEATQGYLAASKEVALAVGQLIDGRYKLLERIGEGGMGEVWVADQLAPVRRRVAVKLIKPGMDSRGVLARFEAERQALAVMDHPNIAKVLDAGTTADGRPYFVMELVKGTPITEFADARKLTPNERLALFVPVCQAIQHAHQKGVIHRDIKPSNVLVELHDDRLVPKVIDFGVAKAVGQPLTEKTIYTGLGTLVGTPAYMAPEQATFNALDIDIRADVYALGVLLYELLAGSPPMESERLKKAALDEVLRLVREEEPPRPSQRLSTSQAKASIAAVRGSDPGRLSALMRGELDWIVMKALEKDRDRRYDTATALAKDVQRYLGGDSVEACPPTLGYRLRKAYRRNRAAVLVGAAFMLMLVTGVTVATVLAIHARRAELVAREKEQEAQEQRKKAEGLFTTASSLQEVYLEAAVEAEIRNIGSRLDADLLEYKSDARVGLLRLARPLKENVGPIKSDFPAPNSEHFMSFDDDPELVKLREFQAAAVITAGQEFVPLVPPLEAAGRLATSPDGRWFLSHTDQGGLVLWSIPSLKLVDLTREAQERILCFGFTPDSKTIWTQDVDSIVRFWNTDGTLRAKTPLRPERFVYPVGLTAGQVRQVADCANKVLVADGVAVITSLPPMLGKPGSKSDDWNGYQNQVPGPTDLYRTRTGQLIRRLDRPGWKLSDFKLAASGRWLTYQEERYDTVKKLRDLELVIVSAEDGRELARLNHPGSQPFLHSGISPSGKWVLTYRTGGVSDDTLVQPGQVRLWRSSDWRQVDDEALRESFAGTKGLQFAHFLTDDVVTVLDNNGGGFASAFRIGHPGSQFGNIIPGYGSGQDAAAVGELGGTLLRCGRALTDAQTFQSLNPPRGRRYHPDLAKLAPDGRFFENLDTATEKELPHSFLGKHFPGLGRVGIRTDGEGTEDNPRYYDDAELRILPDPTRLNIPPAMLELWAQVVVGGELGPDGRFQAWDQPTWSTKQRELAAAKPPYPDFPFPGWAATEPHLWWRIRANELKESHEHDRLIDEWRRLTGRVRPKPQPDTWRTPGPVKEPTPPPRAVK